MMPAWSGGSGVITGSACVRLVLHRSDTAKGISVTVSPQNPGLKNWATIVFLSAIWGSAFMAMELALDGFGPWWVAALRTAVGAPFLIVVATVSQQGIGVISANRAWPYVMAVGIVGIAMPILLLSWGQQFVPSAFAGVAMGSVPLVLVPLAFLFLRKEEEITALKIAGLLTGFAGLVVLIGPGAFAEGEGGNIFWGRMSCVGAASCYAVASVITRRSPKTAPLAFAAGVLTTASVVLLPLAFVFEGLPGNLPFHSVAAVIYAALIPTAFATVLRVQVIQTAGSLFMSTVSYMVPVFSVAYGVLLLGEVLRPGLYMALALILTGIAVSQSKSIRAALRN